LERLNRPNNLTISFSSPIQITPSSLPQSGVGEAGGRTRLVERMPASRFDKEGITEYSS
jgi:hypothetical protein